MPLSTKSGGLSTDQTEFLSHWEYDAPSRKLKSNRAIETTLNSLYLGEQHKMSSGADNIFFTNLSNDTNFYPMWGGLKDQSITANRGSSGFIPPKGRVYSDFFSLPLGGDPDPLEGIGYDGDSYFGINISGLGITTTAAETVGSDVRLEYRITVNGKQVYIQVLPRAALRSSAGTTIYSGSVIEWFFDHPVEINAGTTLNASIHKVRESDDVDLGVFQVKRGQTPNADGSYRYQTTVHNRLWEDKDLELISPYLKHKAMDFGLDSTGSTILLRDLTLGVNSLLVPHAVNTLEAVANGTEIAIKIKGGAKIIVEGLPVNAVSINGSFVNSVLNLAIVQLNELFTNTSGFITPDTFVSSFILSGNELTLGLNDGVSYTVNITNLGVDENNFVASGALNGSDLTLTMSDGTTVVIDATNMINGSSTFASGADWYYSYGDRANESVNNTISDVNLGIAARAPFYFGTTLTRGTEFRWNSNPNKAHVLGIWDGTEANAGTFNSRQQVNWSTGFWRDTDGFRVGSNTTLTNTTTSNRYVPSFGAALAIRFLNDGHVVIVDLSGSAEVEIAKTTNALVVDSFQLQLGCDAGFVLPQFIPTASENLWEIVHDYNDVENGILNGILDHTVIKSGLSIVKGEKLMFMLDYVGNGDSFGTSYINATTGVVTAEEELVNHFRYQTNEALVFTKSGVNDWVMSTGADGYFFASNLDNYRNGGESGTIQGMFSLRFNNDGKLTIYDEDAGQKVATAKSDPVVGSTVHLYMGARGNRTFSKIPVISKQLLSQSNQPNVNYVPVVADQTTSVEEGAVLNFQVVSSDNIVNQFVEVDAPSWLVMNQSSGVLSGTAPAFLGTGADTIVVTCKAGNAIGGSVDFTVTVSVTSDASYTNSKSLALNGTSTYLHGNATLMNSVERATNGDGNAWSIGMWIKPTNNTATQTLFNYGHADDQAGGAITIKKINVNTLAIIYGTVYTNIITQANVLNHNQWSHVLVTFDGGTTGGDPNDMADYYNRFKVYLNGFAATTVSANSLGGYTGVISGADSSTNIYRFGRANNAWNNYLDGIINQIGIWATDESANVAAIYNGGVPHDLSLLTSTPTHYYEIDSSVTTIPDLAGNAPLTGYNFITSDLVTDTP